MFTSLALIRVSFGDFNMVDDPYFFLLYLFSPLFARLSRTPFLAQFF